jgi:hypothetical protein
MKKLIAGFFILSAITVYSQDSTEKRPVQIFSSGRTINANTTEMVGAGKMDFNVTHNFGDIAGKFGGIKRFFGLDDATDVRIGFTVGLCDKFQLGVARYKGASAYARLFELSGKYLVMQQRENDPSHPLAIAFFANIVASSTTASPNPNQENSFRGFSDRLSDVFQLIVAKKIGKVSVQLNPTYFTRGYSIRYDQKNIFSLGGAIRVPLGGRFNLVVDYFHNFRNQSSRDSFIVNNNTRFYDPLGIGLEILTSGHVFRLNFTNATEILENRFIPRTVSSWGKGGFRWGFNISRKFNLWREKEKIKLKDK